MPGWDPAATLSTCFNLKDISKACQSHNLTDGDKITPVLKLIENEKAKGYDKLCLPLTTEKWKERWSQMCLLPTESSESDKESAAKAAEAWRLNPVFRLDEVTITRLGVYNGKKKKSKSIQFNHLSSLQMKLRESLSWRPIG